MDTWPEYHELSSRGPPITAAMIFRPEIPHIPTPFHLAILHGPRTLLELRMHILSGRIREEPDWWQKVHDAGTVSRWRAEICNHDSVLVDKLWGREERWYARFPEPRSEGETEEEYQRWVYSSDGYREGPAKHWPRDPISDSQLDCIFDELKYDAGRADEATGIYPTAIHGVFESRALIPAAIRVSLASNVSGLEIRAQGPNGQVLNLIDPSQYALCIEHSHIFRPDYPKCSEPTEVVTWEYLKHRGDMRNFRYKHELFVSKQYQWLPTDFKLSSTRTGDVIAIPLGYINNLHLTKHGSLYPVISSILARFVPLWERVLTEVVHPPPPSAVAVEPLKWYHGLPPEPDYRKDRVAHDAWERNVKWPSIPEPTPYSPPVAEGRAEVKLGGRTVQVIVKLTTVSLTPADPIYPGDAWRVEGMLNERIVAVGLHYYAMENVTEPRIALRTAAGNANSRRELVYAADDVKGYSVVFGLTGEDALNQTLGSVRAEEGKCVAFPNVYQHQVESFGLVDGSKPGHCKVLCLFLVGPFTRILSTTDVPLQREEWVEDAAAAYDGMQKLPQELYEMVMRTARVGTMGPEQADEHRAGLVDERNRFRREHTDRVYECKFVMDPNGSAGATRHI